MEAPKRNHVILCVCNKMHHCWVVHVRAQVCHHGSRKKWERLIEKLSGFACLRCRPTYTRQLTLWVPSAPVDWVAILEHPTTTRKYVRQSCRQFWAQRWVGAVLQVNNYGDELAWLEMRMLPKC
eukprot:2736881-Amphidinium_carterae.1